MFDVSPLRSGKIALSLLAGCLALGVLQAPALAGEMPSREQLWETIQQLQREVAILRGRQADAREDVEDIKREAQAMKESAADGDGMGLPPGVSLSGVVEVDVASTSDYAGTDSSDITLSTVEIGLDAQINEWVASQLVLKWEEDSGQDIDVDTGTITVGNTEKFPLYVTAGKFTVPFGTNATNMLADPLTLTLGEHSETAVQAGFQSGGFGASVFGYNGTIPERAGKGDFIEHFGANLGWSGKVNGVGLDIGASFVSALDDSDTIEALANVAAGVVNHTPGFTVHGVADLGPFQLIAEYAGAMEPFDSTDVAFNGNGARPAAWTLEAAYNFSLLEKESVFAIGYQGSNEAQEVGLAEDRIIAALGVTIFENTTLTAEYFRDDDYSTAEGGTGNDADTATLRLAVVF